MFPEKGEIFYVSQVAAGLSDALMNKSPAVNNEQVSSTVSSFILPLEALHNENFPPSYDTPTWISLFLDKHTNCTLLSLDNEEKTWHASRKSRTKQGKQRKKFKSMGYFTFFARGIINSYFLIIVNN